MKKIVFIIVAVIVAMSCTSSVVLYKNYIKASEELLWELEELCEYHNIDWGDTVCEGDNWSNYCEAREALGLEYLEHYSKR